MRTSGFHLGFNKKLLIIYTCVLLASLALVGQSLYALHHNLMDDRRQKIQRLVETTLSLVDFYHQQTFAGLSHQQAQQLALETLRELRYGESGYFWVNDLSTRLLVHPTQPHLEGQLQTDYQDSNGQYIFRNFVDLAASQQAGYVHYAWPKPGSNQATDKLSYIELYEPWNWVLGTGIYLDDLKKIFWQEARGYLLVGAVLLIIISYLVWNILRVDSKAFQSNQLMASVMEACAEAIMVTDHTTRIVWANSAFEKLTGYSRKEVQGKKPPQILSSGKQSREFYQELWGCLNRGEHWSGELVNRHKSGRLYYEQMTITPVQDRNGQVSHYVAIKKDISRRKQDQLKLEELASKDSLTGLANRRTFMERLNEYLALREPGQDVVMMLDLDHFKKVNDNFGHQCGDQVLIHLAQILQQEFNSDTLLGRMGGEEFAILVPNCTLKEGLQKAQALCETLEASRVSCGQYELQITTSVGITAVTSKDDHAEKLLDRADKGLYLAKKSGRACVRSPDFS